MIAIKYKDDILRKKLSQYVAICKKDSSQIVQNIGRICALECMKSTQPFGVSNDARDAGQGAVASDFRNIFIWVTPTSWKLLKAFTRAKNPLAELTDDAGKVWATASNPQITDASGAKAFHKKNRTSEGRTSKLAMGAKALVKKAAYKKFRTEQQRKVGFAKAGWGIAAMECKADVRSPMLGIPLWIKNNIAKSSGSADASKAGRGLSFSMKIRSGVNYARRVLKESDQNKAVKIAKEKMVKMMSAAIRYEKAKEAGLKKS